MGEFEAIGDAVTGSLLARAVEPGAGEPGADGHTHEKNCLNCGSPLTGPFCSACGQKSHVHRSLRAFAGDFVAGLLNFEGKFWRTLPMLALQPGEMTRRYIAGERARFISPVALYLFTVFAMFAVLNFTGALNPDAETFKTELKEEIASDQRAIVKLEAERKVAGITAEEKAKIDRKIARRKEDIADSQRIVTGGPIVVEPGDLDPDTPGWVRPLIEDAQKNPELMSQKIQEAASKYSWLLIPISVPFLWLLFPLRRRYNLYDHTVFVTYSLSFMMMLVIASGLLVASGWPTLAAFLFFVPPFHMYRHLKGAYELSRFSAIMRTMALVSFAFAAAGIFMAATVAIGTM
ncbi:MAG TPA: DUF3667 domain-containing protein [Sphingomicrobium sp.]|nr:DUF3667 domain-containing protein [Sphingomicrobium sp.]